MQQKHRSNELTYLFQLIPFTTKAILFLCVISHFMSYVSGKKTSQNRIEANTDLLGNVVVQQSKYSTVLDFLKADYAKTQKNMFFSAACSATIGSSSATKTLVTEQGFVILVPEPELPLAELIEKVPIIFVGEADAETKKNHAAMLRELLPAACPPQLAMKIFSEPSFEFVISYEKNPPYNGWTVPKTLSIVLSVNTKSLIFSYPFQLLGTLQNEIASMKILAINNCLVEKYGNEDRYARPFLFEWGKTKTIVKHEGLTKTQEKFVKKLEKQYTTFMKEYESNIDMLRGNREKSEQYLRLEQVLSNYIPTPRVFEFGKESQQWNLLHHHKRTDGVFDIYDTQMNTLPKTSETISVYVLRDSYRYTENKNAVSVLLFEHDPRTMPGKIRGLYVRLNRMYAMTLGGEDADYARALFPQRVSEFISFLEELPEAFLNEKFPGLCKTLKDYTTIREDSNYQHYCVP